MSPRFLLQNQDSHYLSGILNVTTYIYVLHYRRNLPQQKPHPFPGDRGSQNRQRQGTRLSLFLQFWTFLKGHFSSRVPPENWLCPLLLMHCNSVSSSASCMLFQVLFLRIPLNKPQACIPLSQSVFLMSPTYGSVTFKQQHLLGLSTVHISNIIHKLIQKYYHHQFLRHPPTLH